MSATTLQTLRPVARFGARPERLLWALAAAATGAGVIGLVWRFTAGHAAADYGSSVPWGLWIGAYVALVGASAGAFGFAALIFMQRRTEYYRVAVLAMLVAFGAFIAGMVNVWLDLGHPLRAWRLVVDTRMTSVMGIMGWLYAIYAVVLIIGLWSVRRGSVPAFMERWAWAPLVLAMVIAGAEGALFGVVAAQATWESGVTPVLFLLEAALFGLALVAAAAGVFGYLSHHLATRLGHALLGLLAAVVVVEFAELSTGLWAGAPAKEETFGAILAGEKWWVFWGLHAGAGVLVPGILLLVGRGRVRWVAWAGGLIAAMALASKLTLVVPALVQEDIEGLAGAFTGPGLVHDYFPSPMEWLVAVGTVGIATLIVLIGRHLLAEPLAAGSAPQSTQHPMIGRQHEHER